MLNTTISYTHYKIKNNKIWDIHNACFVTETPEDAVIVELTRNGEVADTEYLKKTLQFYNFVVGYELLTLKEAQDKKLKEINNAYEIAMLQLTASYPDSEMYSFTKQETEARAWKLDNGTSTPFLDSLCKGRNIDKSVLVDKVITKADMFTNASGYLTGTRQKYEDALLVADSVEAVKNINPVFELTM